MHFGLGAATRADEVQIRWPSGIVQELRNLPGDRIIHVKESN
jgi:enediyne biosynthesis protein E4